MGVAAGEGEEDALADHAAVFIVGLGQHQDVLGHAAGGHHVPPAQAVADLVQQIFHGPVQAALGQGLVVLPLDGDEGDVHRVAAAGD